jgi:hypothetical protein
MNTLKISERSQTKRITSGNVVESCNLLFRSRFTIELSSYIDLALEYQSQIKMSPAFYRTLREFQTGQMPYFFPFMKREGVVGLQKFLTFDEVIDLVILKLRRTL